MDNLQDLSALWQDFQPSKKDNIGHYIDGSFMYNFIDDGNKWQYAMQHNLTSNEQTISHNGYIYGIIDRPSETVIVQKWNLRVIGVNWYGDDYKQEQRGFDIPQFTNSYSDAHIVKININGNITNVSNLPNLIKTDRNIYDCNFPIFYADDTPSIQAYKDNGDVTNAVNYNDLFPIQQHYTINVDGNKNPHLYFNLDIVQGEDDTCLIGITSDDSSTGYYSTYLKSNIQKDITWAYLSEILPRPLLATLDSVNITIVPLTKQGEPSSQVLVKIYKNGTFDILTNPSRDGNNTITIETGEPSTDDYPTDDDDFSENTDNENYYSGANTLTKTYKLSDARIRDFGSFIWSSDFFDNIRLLNNSPIENVISIKAMPISDGGADEEIILGNVSSGIMGNFVSNADNIRKTVGRRYIAPVFNNYLDYTETSVTIYLPYIGFKSLDPKIVIGNTISVDYTFDCILGTCLAIISIVDSDNNITQVDCFNGACGIDIPISSNNRNQVESSIITNAISGVVDIASGNIMSAVGNVGEIATTQFHSKTSGVGSPSGMVRMSSDCYLLINTPKKFTPKNYGHTYGYPCYLSKKLIELHGFTVITNFDTNDIEIATYEEREELRSLFASGVYL